MIALSFALASLARAGYREYLEVTPLSRNEVLSEFTFEMSQPSSDLTAEIRQFSAFPRSLGQILELSHTSELHLRFGQGGWDEARWGPVPQLGGTSGGVGVELWAFVEGSSDDVGTFGGMSDADPATKNWHKLTHALGGYFCASINFINSASTTWPSAEILPQYGVVSKDAQLLRGALPAEPICTENLTPFLKLIPCRGKAGIASLLDGHTLFAARWQSMSVDVWLGEDGELHLRQRISAVHDTNKAIKELPYPEPKNELICDKSKPWANDWTCLPLAKQAARFDFREIFGTEINGVCPQVANGVTEVSVNIPPSLQSSEPFVVNNQTGETHYTFELHSGDRLNLEISSPRVVKLQDSGLDVPPLRVGRSISGWGQQNGGVRTVFENTRDYPLRVLYLETLPWFMRPYLYTTTITEGSGRIERTNYSPGIDRERPSTLEREIIVEPHARFELKYDFDRSLLFLEEYPPDANHGFEVPPGLAVAFTSDVDGGRYETRTASLLLALPVPDFSMPYNVIILTSTVMALAFGTIYNLVDRKVVPEDKVPQKSSFKELLLKKLRLR